jgi:hypothetical protein
MTQSPPTSGANPLSEELTAAEKLFEAQPPLTQRFLETQAHVLGEALAQEATQARFRLPDRVVPQPSGESAAIPEHFREQMAGGLVSSLMGADLRTIVRHRLVELESSGEPGVIAAAQLIRYVTTRHMVYQMLPSGRSVTYIAAEGEEIPTIPVTGAQEAASAITAESDVIVEEGDKPDRGELVVPYVPAARRFYLPQWVAFDDQGSLLVNTVQEAESFIASMQRFTAVLHAAVSLAPYVMADEEYQRKRYGILGQLINQGRALATYQIREIVATIKQRAAANDLNRGLSLSLPYFDDQDLQIKLRHFEVIPSGRIMFVPAFIVHAAREEQAKIAQDTRLSASTRKYLLNDLEMLGEAFLPASELHE